MKLFSLAAVSVILAAVLATVSTNSAPSKNSVSPYPAQRLNLSLGSSGPIIHGLFGRFPPTSASNSCNQNFSSTLVKKLVSTSLAPPTGCNNPQCPSGSQPGGGGCITPAKEQALARCSYNQSCTQYHCVSSTSGCCTVCVWYQTDCWSCVTTSSCN